MRTNITTRTPQTIAYSLRVHLKMLRPETGLTHAQRDEIHAKIGDMIGEWIEVDPAAAQRWIDAAGEATPESCLR